MNGIHFSIQLTTPEFIAERGSVSCSSKKHRHLSHGRRGPLCYLYLGSSVRRIWALYQLTSWVFVPRAVYVV